MYLSLQIIVFQWKQIHFVLYFNKNSFQSDFKIFFRHRNTCLIIFGNCEIITVSKISRDFSFFFFFSFWPCKKDQNKNENRMRAWVMDNFQNPVTQHYL